MPSTRVPIPDASSPHPTLQHALPSPGHQSSKRCQEICREEDAQLPQGTLRDSSTASRQAMADLSTNMSSCSSSVDRAVFAPSQTNPFSLIIGVACFAKYLLGINTCLLRGTRPNLMVRRWRTNPGLTLDLFTSGRESFAGRSKNRRRCAAWFSIFRATPFSLRFTTVNYLGSTDSGFL